MSKQEGFLEILGVTKRFGGKTAVSEVSLSIKEGEIVCLLGPSGCGKTTLLRLVAGLERLDAGQVVLEGRDLTQVPPHERGIGMMFQDYALFPHKNVFGNVAFGLQVQKVAADQVQARVAEMLTLVDLVGYEERDVGELSGGERQRVALARALAPGPHLLLLDEPLGALDRALRERLMVALRQILKQVGVTAVTVTHDQTEALAIADRIVVMNEGRIEQIDSPQAIYARPRTRFVARFLGFENVLVGSVVGDGIVRTEIGEWRLETGDYRVGDEVGVLMRPDGVVRKGGGLEIEGMVTAVSFRGRFTQVWVLVNGVDLMFEVSGKNGRWAGWRPYSINLISGSSPLVVIMKLSSVYFCYYVSSSP